MLNAREVFDKIAADYRARGELDQAAKIELAREYFCNPTFRKALEDHLWNTAARVNQHRNCERKTPCLFM